MKIGKLTVITGCMFAGKTEELLKRIKRLEYANKHFLIFKPEIDNRYSNNEIVSHNGNKYEAILINTNKFEIFSTINKEIKDTTETIFIDEIQFFKEWIINDIMDILNYGLNVVVCGLDLDFRNEPFEITGNLLARADEIIKLKAVCIVCGNDAKITYRKKDWNYEESNIEIGGKDLFEARCKVCWYER